MRKLAFAAASALAMMLAAAPASAATTLTTGTGDGQATLSVRNRGAFFDAFYNPVGSGDIADAVASSYSYFRANNGAVSQLDGDGDFVTATATSATSVFAIGSFQFSLVQTLSSLLDANDVQSGSRLTQAFTVTNLGLTDAALDLTRFIDGDLIFQSNSFQDDGGGRIAASNGSTLFETDLATGANDQASFVGIDAAGGADERYDIDQYDTLRTRIQNGGALRNAITGDANNDGFIDAGPGYDVGLALSRAFTVGAGQSVTFTTGTIFGTGTPAAVVGSVPEPATWGLMLVGFGLVGAGLRARRRSVTFSAA